MGIQNERVNAAIEALKEALYPRHFLLLLDPVHPDSQSHFGLSIIHSKSPLYALGGMAEFARVHFTVLLASGQKPQIPPEV